LESLPNTLEPRWLEQFIRAYPNATETPVAFTLRYRIVQGINTIPAYQAFIDAYPRTLAAMEAQYALLRLYRPEKEPDRQKRLAGYLDFMYRYPNTSLALVAKPLKRWLKPTKLRNMKTSCSCFQTPIKYQRRKNWR